LPAPFEIPHLNNQFYGHGAFFGAAGQLLNDAKWNVALQSLMPDVHGPVMDILASGGGSKGVLLKFENNPVCAAYGITKLKEMDDAQACSLFWNFTELKPQPCYCLVTPFTLLFSVLCFGFCSCLRKLCLHFRLEATPTDWKKCKPLSGTSGYRPMPLPSTFLIS
jgi:hypothetical protein